MSAFGFTEEEMRQAKFAIVVNRVIGARWSKHFKSQDEAAMSWLEFQNRNPESCIEEWFNTMEPGTFKIPNRVWKL